MLKYTFSGPLKESIIGFIEEKHMLGFVYGSEQWILKRFDTFCVDRYPDAGTITPEMGLAWSIKSNNEKMSTLEGRVCVIRELSRFMNRSGMNAFIIPKGIGRSGVRYTPHIFTDTELKQFFFQLDQMKIKPAAPAQHLLYPVLFRLLYSCGLRPYEAVNLSVENVNITTGVIFIERSKGNLDRYVVVSDDVLRLLRKYHQQMYERNLLDQFFFPNVRGGQLNTASINRVFRKCWNDAKIPDPYGNPPRVYDFRHSFATKRLFDWHEEGKDLNAMLPYLSTYMGHARLSATAYYIHLVPEFFPDTRAYDTDHFETLIPEVRHE